MQVLSLANSNSFFLTPEEVFALVKAVSKYGLNIPLQTCLVSVQEK